MVPVECAEELGKAIIAAARGEQNGQVPTIKELEAERRALVSALLKNHEAVGKLANAWELAATKKLAGEGN